MKAIITRDNARVVMVKERWRQTITAADLPGWIARYTALRDRNAPRDKAGKMTAPGPYHQFYAADVDALIAAQRKLKEAQA